MTRFAPKMSQREVKVVVDYLQLLPPPTRSRSLCSLHCKHSSSSAGSEKQPSEARLYLRESFTAARLTETRSAECSPTLTDRGFCCRSCCFCCLKAQRCVQLKNQGGGARPGERRRRKCQSSRKILGRNKMNFRQLASEAAAGFLGRL